MTATQGEALPAAPRGGRMAAPDLPTPHPLVALLPAVLQEDQFLARMTTAFDTVLAPVIATLDCLDSYFAPKLAPADFLEWLAAWLGTALDDNWDDDRRRTVTARAAGLHRVRGTAGALTALVELATGGTVEIYEPGGVTWSASPTPDDEPPAGDTATEQVLYLRVTVADPSTVRLYALDEMVAAAKPAHLPHMIEVVSG